MAYHKYLCGIVCNVGTYFSLSYFLKVDSGGDVPSLNGCEDWMDWGELTDLDLKLEEFPNDSKLLLFFDD